MLRKHARLYTGLALAFVALFAFAGVALAQATTTTPTPGTRYGMGPGMGMMGSGSRMGGYNNSLMAVAAEQLGMTQAELVTALNDGGTIAQVAQAHNVALDTIVNAFLAPRQELMAQRVAAGYLTQEQADQMLATMREQVTARLSEPFAAGVGLGRGGMMEGCPMGDTVPGTGVGTGRGGRRGGFGF